MTNKDVGNIIANINMEDSYWSDNIGVALLSYFERHIDCPDDDKIDEDTGYSIWAMKQTDKVLERIGQVINDMLKSS